MVISHPYLCHLFRYYALYDYLMVLSLEVLLTPVKVSK